jgi:hypothetical protein
LKVWIPVEPSDLLEAIKGEFSRKAGEPVLDVVKVARRRGRPPKMAAALETTEKKPRRKRRWHRMPPEERARLEQAKGQSKS